MSSSSELDNHSEYITIGAIGRPVGLDGWCRIITFGSTLSEMKLPASILVGNKLPEKSVTIVKKRMEPKGLKAVFDSYSDKDSVDTLKNFQIFLEKENLPKNQDDEYYHFELEGMGVYGQNEGEYIGKVTHVHNYPTVDALEIKRDSGYSFTIPLNKETVVEINKEEQRIIVSNSILNELL